MVSGNWYRISVPEAILMSALVADQPIQALPIDIINDPSTDRFIGVVLSTDIGIDTDTDDGGDEVSDFHSSAFRQFCNFQSVPAIRRRSR